MFKRKDKRKIGFKNKQQTKVIKMLHPHAKIDPTYSKIKDNLPLNNYQSTTRFFLYPRVKINL